MFGSYYPIVREADVLLLTNSKLMASFLSTGHHVCALLPNEINDGCCLVQVSSALYRADLEACIEPIEGEEMFWDSQILLKRLIGIYNYNFDVS